MIRTICCMAGVGVAIALIAIAVLFIEPPQDGDRLDEWCE